MELALENRRQLETDLRKALLLEQFTLHFQPQFSLADGGIVAMEALLRWQHPLRGPLAAQEFLPIAEENGTILEIADWALMEACRLAVDWPAAVRVAVNVADAQFHATDFVDAVTAALRRSGLAPERLELEVAERVFADNQKTAGLVISQLRERGVRISLDGFGSNWALLRWLEQVRIDKIKLDRTIFRREGEAAWILPSIRSLEGALGLEVVAQGVETEAEFAGLRSHGFDLAQGYFIGRPLAADRMGDYLAGLPRNLISNTEKKHA